MPLSCKMGLLLKLGKLEKVILNHLNNISRNLVPCGSGFSKGELEANLSPFSKEYWQARRSFKLHVHVQEILTLRYYPTNPSLSFKHTNSHLIQKTLTLL
ncbi:hypothetical protein L2E82_05631 [Cichorium intybus]|uniref:Uncharacterized protein n=1 Tax=Cichorium intybus TaxID=13427 RepID=A0ACB9H7C7_CICIN|nr:hypothetical protein L2E82_05631 [Cichorium intybus]